MMKGMYTNISSYFKICDLSFKKNLRVYPTKFHANFHTSESHENCYNKVFGYAEHESEFIFMITIISNCN